MQPLTRHNSIFPTAATRMALPPGRHSWVEPAGSLPAGEGGCDLLNTATGGSTICCIEARELFVIWLIVTSARGSKALEHWPVGATSASLRAGQDSARRNARSISYPRVSVKRKSRSRIARLMTTQCLQKKIDFGSGYFSGLSPHKRPPASTITPPRSHEIRGCGSGATLGEFENANCHPMPVVR